MRLLVVSNLYPPRVLGGYELSADKISRGLRGRGHEVHVLTSPAWEASPADAHDVERVLGTRAYLRVPPTSSSVHTLFQYESKVSHLDNTLRLLDALRRHRPHHVMFFNTVGIGGLALLDLVEASGIPWTWNLGDRIPSVLLEEVDPAIAAVYEPAALFSRASITALSRTLVDELAADGFDFGDVHIIPRGVPDYGVRRTRGYREGGVTRFTAASALEEFKGVGIILEAAALLRDRGVGPFTVDIYGPGDRTAWRRRAEAYGLDGVVSFPGMLEQGELLARHAEADAFLFPTWHRESGGSAPYEAASVGCVPLVTAGSGTSEQLIDGQDSLLVERDATAFADAMAAVCDGSVDLAALGEGAQRSMKDRLSFDRSLERLETVLVSRLASTWDRLDGDGLDERVLHLDDRVTQAVAERIRRDEEAHIEARVMVASSRRWWRRRL